MKKIGIILALISACSVAVWSQTTAPVSKVGYADVDYIFEQMPEYKQIEAELSSLQTQLKKQYDAKVQEFQKKLAEYQSYGNTVPDAVKQNTERELQQMQQNLQNLQEDSQQNLQKKQTDLMAPVYDKVGKNIADVAKENGYTMIVTANVGGIDVVLFKDDRVDISDLVLRKMGITPQPVTDSTSQTSPTTPTNK